MKVRLTKKLAESIDGVNLGASRVGDVLELPEQEARLLIAEDWATPRERREQSQAVEHDRRTAWSPPLEDLIDAGESPTQGETGDRTRR